MFARRLWLAGLGWVCALAGVLVFAGVPAQAAVIHAYLPEVSKVISEGVPASSGAAITGRVSGLGAMTFDSGHLWVAEYMEGVGRFRVDEFEGSSGAFVSQLPQVTGLEDVAIGGVAVAHGTVYVGAIEHAAEGRVAVFSETGALLGSWTGAATPAGSFGGFSGVADIAVDRSAGVASGSVYVDDRSQGVVDAFKPEAVGKEPPVTEPSSGHVSQLKGVCPGEEGSVCAPAKIVPFNNPSHVRVDDSTGKVLVLDFVVEEVGGSLVGRSVVDVFEPEVLGGYVFVRQIKLPVGDHAFNLGVDGGNGEIYATGSAEGEEGSRVPVVDEFSAVGAFLGRITGENTPAGNLQNSGSVAVDPVSHRVFVGDKREEHSSVVDVFGPDIVIPDVATSAATGVTNKSATLNGTVKLDKEGEATCRFVWGTSKQFGQSTPCSKPVTEEESSVQATLGLQPDTTYYYRLQATNKNGTNPGEPTQDRQFATLGAGLRDRSAVDVASTSVSLKATIDPNNTPTTYYFQYGTDSSYGSAIPAVPGASIGSGKGDVAVIQHLQGLSAGTTYHYRAVAVSELSPGMFESFDGPDGTFTTQQAGTKFALPDGRQWELVSPPNKHGALIEPLPHLIQAADDGSAVTYTASAPIESEPQGYSVDVYGKTQVRSARGVQGWSSRDIGLPHTGPTTGLHGSEYPFFSSDLSLSLAFDDDPSVTLLSDRASEVTPYVRNEVLCDASATANECYLPVLTSKEGFADVPPGTKFALTGFGAFASPFLGATPDLKHMLLESKVPLTSIPGDNGGVYEWSAGVAPAEALQPVGVFPASEGRGIGSGVAVGGAGGSPYGASRNTISADGSRVSWEENIQSAGRPSLFLRDMVKRETVALDVQQPGALSGSGEPIYTRFQIASSDGSRVFFTSGEEAAGGTKGRLLTAQSGKSGRDLYECEIIEEAGKLKCRLTDITPEIGGHPSEVRGLVPGAGEDGSYVYFVANGVLGDGAERGAKQGSCTTGNEGAMSPESVTCNLYVYHDGTVRFISALSLLDELDWAGDLNSSGAFTSRVSPDGRYFTFMSLRSLTGYDNHDAVSGKPDEEVYLYDAVSKHLSCVSCNPTGGRPTGVEGIEFQLAGHTETHQANLTNVMAKGFGFPRTAWVAANLPLADEVGQYITLYPPQLVSDNGRVFFNSSDALVPQDVNGNEDVYEFEPVGTGDCSVSSVSFNSASGGCVGLISSGTSPEESGFMDASRGGGDVFFLTASRLTSQDYDGSFDVYDAHECSSAVPCVAPVVSSPPCSSGDSCKASPALQPPVFGAPPSATFTGAGNVTGSVSPRVVGGKSLTSARKLARALRECRKKPKRKRGVCERHARARYGGTGARKATRKARG